MSDAVALGLRDICRTFHQGGRSLDVLRGVSLEVQNSEIVALVGPSGSGKSTLLHIAGLLEQADGGEVILKGQSCSQLSERDRTRMRRDTLGFVYQFHHLLPEFSAVENVMVPLMIGGATKKEAMAYASDLLSGLGLGDRLSHRPGRLSGGEQQRVAIARALAAKPAVLLADEPTGNLDPKTAERVFDQMLSLVRETGLAAFVATHNPDLASRMDRAVVLEDGVVRPA